MLSGLFTAVSQWKREAARESTEKYFFPFRDVGRLELGDASFVIGRKGTGKTAIADYFAAQAQHDVFCESLSFKSFPFHLLYALKDESYPRHSQYISLWKFVIYASVCRMMVRNEAIDPSARELLSQRFPQESESKLRAVLDGWVSRSFGVQILGTGGTFSTTKNSPISNDTWHKELSALEAIVRQHLDTCKYYLTFDALDDDYQQMLDADQRKLYLGLITSLFKAIDEIRNDINTDGRRLYAVAFLRDDIFDRLTDSDRNKWEDVILRLTWNRDSMQRLLAYRIARAADSRRSNIEFDEAWQMLFTDQMVSLGGDSPKQPMFFYLMNRTYQRPRDYIVYLARCAKIALDKDLRRVDLRTFLGCEFFYSEYFRQELHDEMAPVVPEIDQVFAALSNMGKATFSLQDYKDAVNRLSKTGAYDRKAETYLPEQLMQILFLFNVVGNRTTRGRRIFRYVDPDENLNIDQAITIHSGLWKSFHI